MKRSTIRTGLTGVALTATAGLAFAVPNLAQAADEAGTAPSVSDVEEAANQARDEFAERLASELGVEAEDVAAALEKVGEDLRADHEAERLDRLNERLAGLIEDGSLTQEQADAIMAAAEANDAHGLFGLRGEPGHMGRGPGGPGPGLGGGLGGVESESLDSAAS